MFPSIRQGDVKHPSLLVASLTPTEGDSDAPVLQGHETTPPDFSRLFPPQKLSIFGTAACFHVGEGGGAVLAGREGGLFTVKCHYGLTIGFTTVSEAMPKINCEKGNIS